MWENQMMLVLLDDDYDDVLHCYQYWLEKILEKYMNLLKEGTTINPYFIYGFCRLQLAD